MDEADRLSPLVWQQSRRPGRYWVKQGVRFDAAYHGTLRRQREACAAVCGKFKRAGRTLPQAEVLPGLNEYRTQDLVSVIAP